MTGFNRTESIIFASSGYSSGYSFDENGNLDTLKRYAFGKTAGLFVASPWMNLYRL